MPAFAFSRQPDALQWFGGRRGGAVLAAEAATVAGMLGARFPHPWLWLAPVPGPVPVGTSPRGLRLAPEPGGVQLAGRIRCGLPLPLPTEAMGVVVVQHLLDAGEPDALLEECARVLAPGGRLWLLALNPLSPYRLRWRASGLAARTPVHWQQRLRAVGLSPVEPLRYAGPLWRGPTQPSAHAGSRFASACVLEADKRVPGLIPPAPAKRAWRAAPAA